MARLHLYYKKNPLQWMQLSGLNVVINSEKSIRIGNWKEEIEDVKEGKVTVQMSIPYLGRECGIAYVEFEVEKNDDIYLTYKSPIFVTSPGRILFDKK